MGHQKLLEGKNLVLQRSKTCKKKKKKYASKQLKKEKTGLRAKVGGSKVILKVTREIKGK